LYAALFDTGASVTCISSEVARDLKLPPMGKQTMVGVGGAAATNLYQFNCGFPMGQTPQATGMVTGTFAFFPLQGLEFVKTPGTAFDVLLGRDILCKGHLSLSYDGHCIFCW
jgi:hypothetical protein